MDEIHHTQTAPDVVLEVLDAPSIVPEINTEGEIFAQDTFFSPEEAGAPAEV